MEHPLETVTAETVETVPAGRTAEVLPAFGAVPLERNPAAVFLARLAPGSRPAMRGALDTMALILLDTSEVRDPAGAVIAHPGLVFPWERVGYQHAQAVRAALTGRYAWRTANKMLSALRQVVTEAWRLGLLDAEAKARVCDVPNITGESLLAGRALSRGELRALFADCAEDPNVVLGARDAAVLALLYGTGLRRAELVSLDLDAHEPETGALRVLGKRNKARIVYTQGGVADALDDWLTHRGTHPGPIFSAVNKAGTISPRRLSTTAVANTLATRAAQAGLRSFSPHDLRRTFISDLLDAGADISAVQQLAGHANVATTVRYDRRDERAKQKAAALLTIPYQPRKDPPTDWAPLSKPRPAQAAGDQRSS